MKENKLKNAFGVFEMSIVKRLFARLFAEVFILLENFHVDCESVHKAMANGVWDDFIWSFPLFHEIDEIGFLKIQKALSVDTPPLLSRLNNHNRERGFYLYNDSGSHPTVQETLAIWYPERKEISPQEFVQRIIAGMIVEAFLMLNEGFDRYEIDRVMSNYGFPCDGPLHLAQKIKTEKLVQMMIEWYGEKDPVDRNRIHISHRYCPGILQYYGDPFGSTIFTES